MVEPFYFEQMKMERSRAVRVNFQHGLRSGIHTWYELRNAKQRKGLKRILSFHLHHTPGSVLLRIILSMPLHSYLCGVRVEISANYAELRCLPTHPFCFEICMTCRVDVYTSDMECSHMESLFCKPAWGNKGSV